MSTKILITCYVRLLQYTETKVPRPLNVCLVNNKCTNSAHSVNLYRHYFRNSYQVRM